jgi:hypothetical protein
VQEEFAAMRDMYMRSGHGFLLVYDVTSTASFAEMAVFRNQILSSKDVDSVPLVILGNKCDIEDAREISTEQGGDLAVQLGAKFFEGSAKFRKNVDEAFFAVVPTLTAGCYIDCAHVPADAVRSDPTDSGRAPAKSSGAGGHSCCCCCCCCSQKEIDVLGAVNYCLGTAAQKLGACICLKKAARNEATSDLFIAASRNTKSSMCNATMNKSARLQDALVDLHVVVDVAHKRHGRQESDGTEHQHCSVAEHAHVAKEKGGLQHTGHFALIPEEETFGHDEQAGGAAAGHWGRAKCYKKKQRRSCRKDEKQHEDDEGTLVGGEGGGHLHATTTCDLRRQVESM